MRAQCCNRISLDRKRIILPILQEIEYTVQQTVCKQRDLGGGRGEVRSRTRLLEIPLPPIRIFFFGVLHAARPEWQINLPGRSRWRLGTCDPTSQLEHACMSIVSTELKEFCLKPCTLLHHDGDSKLYCVVLLIAFVGSDFERQIRHHLNLATS